MKTRYKKMRDKKGNIVYVHRKRAEEKLGRKLKPWEVVDHINRNTHDNRKSNLKVVDLKKHMRKHYKKGHVHQFTQKERKKGAKEAAKKRNYFYLK